MNWKNVAIMVGYSVGRALCYAVPYGLFIGIMGMLSSQYTFVYVAVKIFSIFFCFLLMVDMIWYLFSIVMYKKYQGENIKRGLLKKL